MKTIAVIGSGSWGVALSIHLAKLGNKIKLWSFAEDERDLINGEHKCKFLPNVDLPDGIECSNSYEEVMAPKAFTPLSEDTNLGTKAGSMLLDTGSFSKSTVISYRLRMWLGSNAVIDNLSRTFKVRVSVNAKVDLND